MPKFYVCKPGKVFDYPEATEPYFVLHAKEWDDYGSRSLYKLEHRDSDRFTWLGDIKIIHREKSSAPLRPEFPFLEGEYLSLGQGLSYYKNWRKTFGKAAKEMLALLRDATLLPGAAAAFENLGQYTNSLLRSNEAQEAYKYGARTLSGKSIDVGYSFNYKCALANADKPIDLLFDFDKEDELPYRINALIGQNGAGKTSILAKLALDLAPPDKETLLQRKRRDLRFNDDRPLFSRVIAISLSAFDEFERPEPSDYISYLYCGIKETINQDSNGITEHAYISPLSEKLSIFLKKIDDEKRQRMWEKYGSEILGTDVDFCEFFNALPNKGTFGGNRWSSGQSTLLYCISALIAYAKPDSLILFDEPELHLHPNALSQLLKVMSKILGKLDSYAILATHSPIVLQEIPTKRVLKLNRFGNTTIASHLGKETFGEDVSPLTELVFETINIENQYKITLSALAKKFTFEEVEKLFERKLSLNAASYLLSRYPSHDTKAEED